MGAVCFLDLDFLQKELGKVFGKNWTLYIIPIAGCFTWSKNYIGLLTANEM